MKNKVKAKVLSNFVQIGKEADYKRIVLDFEEWLDDNQAMGELRQMSGKEVVKILKEVWEEVKSID